MQTRPRPVKYRAKNKRRMVHVPGPSGIELRPHQVLIRPLVTEKGTHSASKYNAYTFMVAKLATKDAIKAAVEELFRVRVEKVRTQITHGKSRRWKNHLGRLADWKKAIVTLDPEDKIEFF